MKCFIAMTFLKDDTNQLYEKVLRDILINIGINPVRIDKVDHNNNINDEIISEIRKSDFMIADLTYARPSVYYEAGFAEREIPVIYTVRRDHLFPKSDNELDSRRIHFDLMMKNIIDWNDPDDQIFRTRLLNRINSIVVHIINRISVLSRANDHERYFDSLSLQEQSKEIREKAHEILNKYGYFSHSVLSKENLSNGRFGKTNGWYLPSPNEYRWLNFEYPKKDPDSIDGSSGKHEIEFNLNANYFVNKIESIREIRIYAANGIIDVENAREILKNFEKLPGELTFRKVNNISIPVLPENYQADVILSNEKHGFNSIRRLLSKKIDREGFLTKLPPRKYFYEKLSWESDFFFVYGGFDTKKVKFERIIHFIEKISSVDNFESRFNRLQTQSEPIRYYGCNH